jgi:hypothetical protein
MQRGSAGIGTRSKVNKSCEQIAMSTFVLDSRAASGYVGTHKSVISLLKSWCRRGESNPRPRDYETLALPLSYAGTREFSIVRSNCGECQATEGRTGSSSTSVLEKQDSRTVADGWYRTVPLVL